MGLFAERQIIVRYARDMPKDDIKARSPRTPRTAYTYPRERSANPNEVTVYVGNIPWSTGWKELKDMFSSFGCTHADVGEARNGRMRGCSCCGSDYGERGRAIAAMNGVVMGDHDKGLPRPKAIKVY